MYHTLITQPMECQQVCDKYCFLIANEYTVKIHQVRKEVP